MRNTIKIPAVLAAVCLSAAAAGGMTGDLFNTLLLPVSAQETEPPAETTARTTPSAIPPTTTQSQTTEPEEETIFPPVAVTADNGTLAPLYEAVNLQRTNAGSGNVELDSMLCDIAVQRIEEFSRHPEEDVAPFSMTSLSSETVVRGLADPNTALSSITLDAVQKKNLVYSGYKKIGIATSADNRMWIFLLSS